MIEIEGLTKKFGSFTAVKDLSLVIPSGELFCFLGPNGAGKTTTIKMLCGLLHPTAGRIRLNGTHVRSDQHGWRELVGYIPDEPFLYERLTPVEFMEFIGDIYGIPRGETERQRDYFFDSFRLGEHANTLIKDLSHGFRQRLIYSATFLHKPSILFIDEPFVGLDPHSIRMIREFLREKAKSGTTIFLTTHILALAEGMVDRIGIISGGRLIATGTLDELKSKSRRQGSLEEVFFSLTTEAT